MTLSSIQGLRAVAALLVLVFHVPANEALTIGERGGDEEALLAGWVTSAYAGVDLFFVISGFIMVYVACAGHQRIGIFEFLFARAARIYPLWWLLAGVMAAYFWVSYGEPWRFAKEPGSAPLSLSDHLLSSFFLYPQEVHPLLGVGWTLVHEVHFYLVFALLLVAPQRYLKWLLALWGGLVISGALAGLAAPLSTNLVQLFFAPLSLEFLMGAAAGLLYVQGVRSFAWTATFIGALGFIAGLAFSPAPDAFTLIWGRVLVFGPPSALIIYGLTALEAEGRLKTPKVLSSIGDWSYALYLSHMLVLSALRRILPLVGDQFETMGAPDLVSGPLQLGAPGVWDNVAYNVLSLTAALIVAWVIYRGFERPALRGAKQLRRRVFHAKDTRTPSAPLQPNVG